MFFGTLNKNKNLNCCYGIGATIRIGQKIQCLPYAGFVVLHFQNIACDILQTVHKYWMQPNSLQVLVAASPVSKVFPVPQKLYKETMGACIHTAKLNASIGSIQLMASNGCSI